jgi:hypothetical protein
MSLETGPVEFAAAISIHPLLHLLLKDPVHRDRIPEAQPASSPMDTGGPFLGAKRPGPEADHSPPTSSEVKNAWSHTSTPP